VSEGEDLTVAEIKALLGCASGTALDSLLTRFADDERAGVRALVDSGNRKAELAREERKRTKRLYKLEQELRADGYQLIAGLDEVGRGALAGPLTAAAVVLPATPRISGLDDSKKLTPPRREELSHQIRERAIAVSVSHISAGEVDSLGMTRALRRVFGLAISGLGVPVDHVVLDGLPMNVAENETAVVKGDGSVAAIAAASIVAKVARDSLMRSLAHEYPEYAFDVNKGYGTSDHLAVIAKDGLCPLHRRSFCSGVGMPTLF
jgi:ribonuclease HII